MIEWFVCFEKSYSDLRNNLSEKKQLELIYENDIQVDVKRAYNEVCMFLDIEVTPTKIPFTKTNPFEIAEIVINYDEVKEVMIKNGYGWMLD